MQSLDNYVKVAQLIAIHILRHMQDVFTYCFVKEIAHEELRQFLIMKWDAGDPFEKYTAEAMRIGHTFSTTFNSNELVNLPLCEKNATIEKVLESKKSTLLKELRAVVNMLKALVESS
ncbi:hypothetical protein L873DRAFT_1790138 [Choiromyces venosus 120613-1]|uniref:Uncharacterized protein n=1 Tax=Choiromyces venosus 120613-1 TaxID=1336337 RepID=A0A3N4JPL6_9PEZI|nr:hypothetical protein L873DRAFT_1790138 [Choiromyces venosus 120613-1]